TPISDLDGRVIGTQCMFWDVTERQRAELQRVELAQEQASRAHAEAAVRLRDEFLSVASHELKTPITSLRGFTELLLRQLDRGATVDVAQLRPMLGAIDRQSAKLARLVGELLDVSRIEVGKLRLDRTETDLVAL